MCNHHAQAMRLARGFPVAADDVAWEEGGEASCLAGNAPPPDFLAVASSARGFFFIAPKIAVAGDPFCGAAGAPPDALPLGAEVCDEGGVTVLLVETGAPPDALPLGAVVCDDGLGAALLLGNATSC